eukprot:scaffold421371_cov108-Attheya_sp.AAC.1
MASISKPTGGNGVRCTLRTSTNSTTYNSITKGIGGKKRKHDETKENDSIGEGYESRESSDSSKAEVSVAENDAERFLIKKQDDNSDGGLQRNYSVTYRLREMYRTLEAWSRNYQDQGWEGDNLDSGLEIFSREKHHMTEDNDLISVEDVSMPTTICADTSLFPIQILDNARKQYLSNINEIQAMKSDIQALGQSSFLMGNESESGPNSDGNKRLIELLVKSNTNSIKLIANSIKLIEKNIKVSLELLHFQIGSVYKHHCQIRQSLCQFKGLGNENTTDHTYSRSSTLHVDSRIDTSKQPSPADHLKMIECSFCETFKNELIELVDNNTKNVIARFQEFVIALFKNAEEYNDNSQADGDQEGDSGTPDVDATLKAILKWNDGKPFTKKSCIKYARPSKTKDNEAKVDQPILQAVICRIIEILCSQGYPNVEERVLHEHEYAVSTERTILSSIDGDKRYGRRIDITTQTPEEFLKVTPPIMLQTPIEIKVARDDKTKFTKALDKGRSQIIGHLSKQLEHDFDFGGIGRNASAVGVSLTHLSIEAIKMSLTEVGTNEVDICTLSTGCVPLLGETFLTESHEEVSRNTNTNGFILLAGVLMHKLRTQHKFTKEDGTSQIVTTGESEDKWTEMTYLGSGAFSNVYKIADGKFLKIPRGALLEKSLSEELKILNLLKKKKENGIPELPHHTLVQIQTVIRGEICIMKGLRLNGIIGTPLHQIMRKDWNNNCNEIIEKVYTALGHAHKQNIFHLDVQPGNIIVDIAQDKKVSVMLSDWGCSVQLTNGKKTIPHFRGCTPYAHDRFMGKNKNCFNVTGESDFASLVYTIYHVNSGKLQWAFEFDRPTNVTTQDMKRRQDFVASLFKNEDNDLNLTFPDDIREVLLCACNLQRKGSSRNWREKPTQTKIFSPE